VNWTRSSLKVVADQLCDFLHQIKNDFLIASVKGLIAVLVLLDLSAAFETIDHDILLERFDKSIGISGTALSWFKSYLSDRSQFVFVNDEASMTTNNSHGVPQGSVLGPILFTLNMLPLGNIIRKHSINFHCYADDTQLYLSIKPEESNQLTKLQPCLKDIKTWMTCNFLMLNSDATEVVLLGPEHLRNQSDEVVSVDDIALASNTSVKNLCVIFNQDLSFNSTVKQISRTAFFSST